MLLFIFALLIAGGIIAYVGDRLGTYIGKKRLTAWGLRPRHTAMLWTVVSGGLIAVLTLAALIGYDRTVQQALLHGPQLLEENYHLKHENALDRQQVTVLDRVTALSTQRAEDAQQKTQVAIGQTRLASQRLLTAKAKLQDSRTQLQARQQQLAAARQDLALLHNDLQATHTGLTAAQQRLVKASNAYHQAQHNFIIAQHRYATELNTVNQIEREGVKLAQQNKVLAARNAELTSENATLDATNKALLTQTTFLQGAHVIYHNGQEIGRDVIPTDLSTAETRRRLNVFLTTLSERALAAGATTGANSLAVHILANAQGTPVDEEDALNALTQSIASEPDTTPGVVVIALAGLNAFDGQQVPIVLQPYDNVLIYPKGAFIAETQIDGTLPENKILNQLAVFLKNRVQPDALNRGMIPRPDPITGERTVGEPTDDKKTYTLVKQIQSIGASAVVTARAAEDTYTSGPLRLDLTAALSTSIPASPKSVPAATIPAPTVNVSSPMP
jgi:hypothetical protein